MRRLGRLRTFPPPGSTAPFCFLHASCNLGIVQVGAVGAFAMSAAGALATSRAILGSGSRTAHAAFALARALRRVQKHGLGSLGGKGRERGAAVAGPSDDEVALALPWFVYERTGMKQPAPLLASPFERLRALLTEPDPPAFMIHAGDQIYYDFPLPRRAPDLEEYRRAYREAFFEDGVEREFLASCPQYMTLDDHEIVDGFARDWVPGDSVRPLEYLVPALRAYDEYVASRQTPEIACDTRNLDRHRGYAFEYGASRFFVLDTRTQRSRGERRMLDPEQMAAFLGWLVEHRERIKFVVSSVPFVAELRRRGEGEDESDDKWTGRPFRAQRDRLLEFIHAHQIGRLVFLVGDMHASYHATLRLGAPDRRVRVEELAGGPIHQLQYATRDDFFDEFHGATETCAIPFRTRLRTFHGTGGGVLRIHVRPGARPEIDWRVVRTGTPMGSTHRLRDLSGSIDLAEPS